MEAAILADRKLVLADATEYLGGGADVNQVREAFKILLSDEKIRAVLINIFGGIMKCDVIAQGILSAVKEVQLHVPLVIRLEGTNVELGKKIIADSGLPIIPADTMDDAAEKVVKAARDGRMGE